MNRCDTTDGGARARRGGATRTGGFRLSRRDAAACVLLCVGLLQMAGDLARLDWLKAVGAATCASPAPKVFSAVRGLETYSTRFTLEWQEATGETRRVRLTPELYARLRGPYNRRNVYGAALAYGPVLADDGRTRPMLEAVSRYSFCGRAPLLEELGIGTQNPAGPVRVRYEPTGRARMENLPRVFEVSCR